MSTITTERMTAEEFYEFCLKPENQGRRLELDEGKVVEMPSPALLHGTICWLTGHYLRIYLFQRKQGYLCTNDTGLIVAESPSTIRVWI